MATPKSALIFLSGCGAGILLTVALLSPNVGARASVSLAGPFIDVPVSHSAALSVADLKSKGIIKGYADDTYHGASPVTRYELAVTLARFAEYYDTSKSPLASAVVPLPDAPAWAAPSRQYLAANHYLSSDAAIFKSPGDKSVTADQFAVSLSSVLDRISDRSLPPTVSQ